ncbi:MAG: C-GCAxxG-C-C family (seleno)protein [Clostridia bacterium]|nr:C-GCAxxG-C-C family (seleno)protein [Clostridia bacterium]
MLKERARYYYLEQDYNCAEAIAHAANEVYGLGLSKDSLKLMSGFGGGMCCGKTCGAVCAALAVISRCAVSERAHATCGFKELCADFILKCEKGFESLDCAIIKDRNATEAERCYKTVECVIDLLEAYRAETYFIAEIPKGAK